MAIIDQIIEAENRREFVLDQFERLPVFLSSRVPLEDRDRVRAEATAYLDQKAAAISADFDRILELLHAALAAEQAE